MPRGSLDARLDSKSGRDLTKITVPQQGSQAALPVLASSYTQILQIRSTQRFINFLPVAHTCWAKHLPLPRAVKEEPFGETGRWLRYDGDTTVIRSLGQRGVTATLCDRDGLIVFARATSGIIGTITLASSKRAYNIIDTFTEYLSVCQKRMISFLRHVTLHDRHWLEQH